MDKKDAQRLISEAANLEELLDALRDIEVALADTESDDPLCVRVDEMIDVTTLPTYGGEVPSDTTGIWSWDTERVLTGEGSWAECSIESR